MCVMECVLKDIIDVIVAASALQNQVIFFLQYLFIGVMSCWRCRARHAACHGAGEARPNRLASLPLTAPNITHQFDQYILLLK